MKRNMHCKLTVQAEVHAGSTGSYTRCRMLRLPYVHPNYTRSLHAQFIVAGIWNLFYFHS